MAICKSCGKALKKHAKFCSQCGIAVLNKSCALCGTELEEDDKFCYICGNAVRTAEAAQYECAKSGEEYPAWQNFAAMCDVQSMLSVGAGSPHEHYLSSERGDKLFKVAADGVRAEWLEYPAGVLAFYGKMWKSERLWLSALEQSGANEAHLHRIYTYSNNNGFSVALDISQLEQGKLDIVRFIVTERGLFVYCYNPLRQKNPVSLMVCAYDGSGIREIWCGNDFVLRGAGQDRLYMICESEEMGRRAIIACLDGTVMAAEAGFAAQLKLVAAALGVKLDGSAGELNDFCWKYIPFIDFSEGIIYAAQDEGGNENLTRRLFSIAFDSHELKECGGIWQLGDVDPTESFREYFDGARAVGFSYNGANSWVALHADGRRIRLRDGNYWDGGAVLGDYFYLDCRGSEPGAWYKISLKDGSERKIEF